MAFRTVTCRVLVCDGCGRDYEHEYTPHWESEGDALDQATDSDWVAIGDRAYCPECGSPHCGNCGHWYGGHDYGGASCEEEGCECAAFTLPERVTA